MYSNNCWGSEERGFKQHAIKGSYKALAEAGQHPAKGVVLVKSFNICAQSPSGPESVMTQVTSLMRAERLLVKLGICVIAVVAATLLQFACPVSPSLNDQAL